MGVGVGAAVETGTRELDGNAGGDKGGGLLGKAGLDGMGGSEVGRNGGGSEGRGVGDPGDDSGGGDWGTEGDEGTTGGDGAGVGSAGVANGELCTICVVEASLGVGDTIGVVNNALLSTPTELV